MHHLRHLGCTLALALLGAACGDSGNGDKASDQGELKQEARERFANGDESVSNDPCADNGWYGDGECDAWCPEGDERDCSDDDIVCALFFTEPDGKCDESDPCGPVQDPDCQSDDGAIACIEIQYPTNGKCEAAKGCEYTDAEDCGDADGLVCPAIWSPADGKCDETDPCGPYTDEDCQGGQTEPADPGDGVSCIEIAYETNGKCEAAPGCEYTDPEDCDDDGMVCTAIYRPKDGKCPPNDPCDPDC